MTKRRDRQMAISEYSLRRSLVVLVLGVALTCIIVGCSTEARYRIKTIIFTGVPPLHEEQAEQEEPVDPAQAARAEQLARQREYREALISPYWQHGPFAAGACELCHNLSQSKSFFGIGTVEAQEPPADTSVSAPSRLNTPPRRLCTNCHVQHGKAYARGRGLQQHKLAAAGKCTTCHHPHQSLRRYMLLGADNRELCAGCHEPISLSGVHATDPAQDCIDCHNAHVGVTDKRLRSDAHELSLLYDGRDDE